MRGGRLGADGPLFFATKIRYKISLLQLARALQIPLVLRGDWMASGLQGEEWHLDKKVPIAIIIALIIQSITFISVAAAWKATVDSRLERLEKFEADNSNQGDRILVLEQQLKFIVEGISRIEKKLDTVEQTRGNGGK